MQNKKNDSQYTLLFGVYREWHVVFKMWLLEYPELPTKLGSSANQIKVKND